MTRLFSLLLAASALLSTLGCGDESTTPTVAESQPKNPIAEEVRTFLEAIRTGDIETSSAQLTPLALKRIQENDMIFAPPASEKALFTVGQVQMFAEDQAVVDSIWVDVDPDGIPSEEQMTWALKKMPNGQWRISGMAGMGPNNQMVLFDFENPESMLSPQPQQQQAQQAPATTPAAGQQQQQPITRQASQPTQDPFR